MSTVQDIIACPQCNAFTFYTDYNIRTWCYNNFCVTCGYRYWETPVTDRKLERETGVRIFKLTKDGKRMTRSFLRPGRGTYTVEKTGSGIRHIGTLPDDDEARRVLIGKLRDKAEEGEFAVVFNTVDRGRIVTKRVG